MAQQLFDGYIFDMDGTLWDAVDSYAEIWNQTIAAKSIDCPKVTRQALLPMMGIPLAVIYQRLVGPYCNDKDSFIQLLATLEDKLMPTLGGRLYPNVRETFEELISRGAHLFMVSNCGKNGLPNFLEFTGLKGLVTDHLSYAQTGCEKDINIRHLVEKYQLKHPVYVGDTTHDCKSSHQAGVPFIWAKYGFGHDVADADFVINSISDLLTI